jgi:hypothetical protein
MTMNESRQDTDQEPTSQLPARLEPLMLGHLLVSGDVDQYRRWRDRIEAIEHQRDLDLAPDSESALILEEKEAWIQMKTTGRLGSAFGLALGLLWTSAFLPVFAQRYDLGLWALIFLLPLPIAWRLGVRLWEDASLGGMRDVGQRPTLRRRVRALVRGLFRGFGAGFGFGFTLTFMQLLLTAFWNPASSVLAELSSDTLQATFAGISHGIFGMLLAPLVSRGTPSVEEEEYRALEAADAPQLPSGE